MENQVFIFGSFSEDEASLFQSVPLESPSKQKQTVPSKITSKENGFHHSHSSSSHMGNNIISKTISMQPGGGSNQTAQLKASQTGGHVSGGELANGSSEGRLEAGRSFFMHGESSDSAVQARDDASGHRDVSNQATFEIGTGHCNADGLLNGLVLEGSGASSLDGASAASDTNSVMQPGIICGNHASHESGNGGNVEDLTNKVVNVEIESEVIIKVEPKSDIESVTLCKGNSDTKYKFPDADVKSPGNGASTSAPLSENLSKSWAAQSPGNGASTSAPLSESLSKSWAARLGVQSELGITVQSLTGQKARGKASSVTMSNSNIGKPKGSAQVTALTGEAWSRSLREVEVSGRRLQPRGLINTGNLCFLNATLQALLSCTPFVHLLHTLQARDIPQVGYPTLRACAHFSKEFEEATTPDKVSHGMRHDDEGRATGSIDVGKPFVPTMFDSVLQSFSPHQPASGAGRNRQEDAQEFLSFTMDRMHEELLRLEGKDQTSAGREASTLTVANDEDDWETVGPKNRTAVIRTHTLMESALSDIFGGQLCSVVKTKGIKASATVQPFLLLHLDILPEAVHTIDDALKLFAAPESLEGYKTAAGKAAVVSASKSVKLQSLPRVLVLHLMRFSYGARGSSKLHKPLRFPLDLTLGRDLLATTISSGSEGRHYELVATVTHHGKDPSRGHYTADSKQSDGQWLRFDDAVVSVVGLNRVLHDQAYMLFYKQVVN